MTVTVIKPGLLSSFQDLGRHGHQYLGVPVGGAMDTRAHRLANLLVGNAQDEATLEITLAGPTLRFDSPACIAISGAQLGAMLNGQAIPNNRPLVLRAGDILSFGGRQSGLRAYIAWHGGVDLPPVLSSRSTYLRGGFGGYQGRALRQGDVFSMPWRPGATDLGALADELWKIKVYLPATLSAMARGAIRAVKGAHAALFTTASVQQFFDADFKISPNSERMGYRLQGPTLSLRSNQQLLSEATSFGSVQVPADGNPIILMADRQTTGGYAKIAHVATVDLPIVAQCMPGDALRFVEITLEEAQQLDDHRIAAFDLLSCNLAPLRALFKD
ncbi:5-oxoprolinase subunit C family protein [Pollutimonas thiosulfatoxidans]|uniref:Carboxylase n=1 Tax=Pollutimonas thiosulfatoxidans TaxID=2028345 RepID=A0A410GFY1_9BURK|nr:biotin-dependent carboxyltransferase family protein [Pollutimonas thiosulfatoxidans]QAA95204.1 carboxylase [Pollutimonas thiosulfatoxidans]